MPYFLAVSGKFIKSVFENQVSKITAKRDEDTLISKAQDYVAE
jgi:hypothetical protein